MLERSLILLSRPGDFEAALARCGGDPTRAYFLASHECVMDELESRIDLGHALLADTTVEEARETSRAASAAAEELLDSLDQQYGASLAARIDRPVPACFRSAYLYPGKMVLSGMFLAHQALERFLARNPVDRIELVAPEAGSLIDGVDGAALVLEAMAADRGIPFHSVVRSPTVSSGVPAPGLASRFRHLLIDPAGMLQRKWERLLSRLRELRSRRGPRPPRILLLEPLYDLEFLEHALEAASVLRLAPEPPAILDASPPLDLGAILAGEPREMPSPGSVTRAMLVGRLRGAFVTHFARNGPRWLAGLKEMDRIGRSAPFDLVAWGAPPTGGFKALLVEDFLERGTPVVGMQHGGSYGVQEWGTHHFDSDFDRCTDYLSYGFDHEDLKDTYPGREPRCRIHPAGPAVSPATPSPLSWLRRPIDVLYPISNAISALEGPIRHLPPALAGAQRQILRYLRSLPDGTCVVKPPLHARPLDLGVHRLLEGFPAGSVIRDLTFRDVLTAWEVRAIVLDYPSTPLLECLHMNCEIFLLEDPLIPFGARARELLGRRVHLVGTPEMLLDMLSDWRSGRLPARRDQGFLDHDLRVCGSRERILSVLFRLASPIRP